MTQEVVDRPLASKVASSAFGMAIRRVLTTLLSGLSTAVVARLLGPDEYGQLASAIATWTLVLAASDFGFSLALGRDMALDVERRGRLLRAAFEMQGVLSFVLAVILVLVALATVGDSSRGEALLILAPSVAFAGFAAARAIFTVIYRQSTAVLIDLSVLTIQVVLMIAAASAGLGAPGVAAAVSLGFAVNAVLIGVAGLRLVDAGRSRGVDRRVLLASVLPLGLMAFLTKVYLLIDLVLLGWLVEGSSLGDYAAATRMLGLLVTLPGLIVGAALPAFASESSNPEALDAIVARVWHWLMVGALPVFVGAALFAPVAVTLAVGDSYEGSVQLFQILTAAGVVSLATNFFGTLLVGISIVRPLLYQNVVALTLNVVGNILLVPRYGVVASAWLTLATELVICVGALILLRRRLRFRTLAGVSVRPLAALAAFTAVGIALASIPVLGIPIATAAFLVVLTALHGWPPEMEPGRLVGRLTGSS